MILGGCGGSGHRQAAPKTAGKTAASASPATTTTSLAPSADGVKAAAQVILAYDSGGQWGTFWDQWDPASQALISRAEYIRRKAACPGATGSPIKVLSVGAASSAGIWTVRGQRGGSQISYQFRYNQGRWWYVVTDATVKAQLKEPYASYVARAACKTK
jgi:hypothetical protein